MSGGKLRDALVGFGIALAESGANDTVRVELSPPDMRAVFRALDIVYPQTPEMQIVVQTPFGQLQIRETSQFAADVRLVSEMLKDERGNNH